MTAMSKAAAQQTPINELCAPYFDAGFGWEDVAVLVRAMGRNISNTTMRRVWQRWQEGEKNDKM